MGSREPVVVGRVVGRLHPMHQSTKLFVYPLPIADDVIGDAQYASQYRMFGAVVGLHVQRVDGVG